MRWKYMGCVLLVAAPCSGSQVEFNRDVRPIFTKHCTSCHGGVKEAGAVSFVYREKLVVPAESGNTPVVPGDPDASELLRRVRHDDPDEVMPPPDHGPALSQKDVATLEAWIKQGAQWQEHWSFVKPAAAPPPAVKNDEWAMQALDLHVLARLESKGLVPSPPASAGEWLRRASFDLTGLPPTAVDLDFLEANDSPQSRAELVDKMLASAAYGERWAAMWLDLARYADSTGFEKDRSRTIWPYRDWLVRAFNRDLPYDQFTMEQLAGDLLENPSWEQRLATAFHRNTQTNTEGGTDDEEYRVAAVIDRVSTTWTAWQATTFGCVQCHAHPYDPFPHDDFYRFMDFFNGSEDSDQNNDVPHLLHADDPAMRERASQLGLRIRALRRILNEPGRSRIHEGDWRDMCIDVMRPTHGTLIQSADGVIRSEGTLPVGCVHVLESPAESFTAIRLTVMPERDDPKAWPERGSLVTDWDVVRLGADGTRKPIRFAAVFWEKASAPFEPTVKGNFGEFPKLNGPSSFVLVPETPVEAVPGERLEIRLKQGAQTEGNQATSLRRFRLSLSAESEWAERVARPERAKAEAELSELGQQYARIKGSLVPVMVERSPEARRETRVFARGNRLAKEHLVRTGVPDLLNPGGRVISDRLEMAKWIASPENPLTARVMVNRLWGELFGLGIVETAEDFGSSGTLPSNQALLDFLALRFQNEHRWSMKAMLRELVLSATYQQTHRTNESLQVLDPRNRLLARGPRNRLSAEMVRDQMLAVSGLLSPRPDGGPPVFPPQPDGLWRSVYSQENWTESTGPDRYRRALYTFVKRTSGFPGFVIFDGPTRDICTARRMASNTPLQALITLNDPAHIEGAKAFAKRLAAHPGTLREKLAYGVRCVSQRNASNAMLDELEALHAETSARYAADPELTKHLAATADEAALLLTANTMLNLDIALTR